MTQSQLLSLLEAGLNVGAGLVLSFLLQLALFDVLDIAATISQNFILTAAFSGLSLVRSYVLRRLFNGLAPRVLRTPVLRSGGTRP